MMGKMGMINDLEYRKYIFVKFVVNKKEAVS